MTEDRAVAMAARLYRTALRNGLAENDAASVARCFLFVMDRRMAALQDPHHPDYLHPARTALILMDDMGETDAATLCAAVLHDSERPDLAASVEEVERLAGEGAARAAAGCPPASPDPTELTEALVAASRPALRIALADRLDHARHVHFGPAERWRSYHRLVTEACLPLAARTHPLLTRRFERWALAFERRFLRRGVQ